MIPHVSLQRSEVQPVDTSDNDIDSSSDEESEALGDFHI